MKKSFCLVVLGVGVVLMLGLSGCKKDAEETPAPTTTAPVAKPDTNAPPPPALKPRTSMGKPDTP